MSQTAQKSAEKHRPRNAAATRRAILLSARAAFARAGYDGVGVREIAAGAGVTAMLVNRYFGSKEALFAAVVEDNENTPSILTPDIIASPRFAQDFAAALVGRTQPGATPLDGFMIMLRSASNPRAAEIWREQIEKHHHRQLTDALPGQHAAERAAMVLSLAAGFQAMRQMIGLNALKGDDPETLIALIARTVQAILKRS